MVFSWEIFYSIECDTKILYHGNMIKLLIWDLEDLYCGKILLIMIYVYINLHTVIYCFMNFFFYVYQ